MDKTVYTDFEKCDICKKYKKKFKTNKPQRDKLGEEILSHQHRFCNRHIVNNVDFDEKQWEKHYTGNKETADLCGYCKNGKKTEWIHDHMHRTHSNDVVKNGSPNWCENCRKYVFVK